MISMIQKRILDRVYAKKPKQRKKIEIFFRESPTVEKDFDDFVRTYSKFLDQVKISWEEVTDAYLTMIDQMTFSRIHFMKTGKYPAANQTEAKLEVYDNKEAMQKYMLGLALSQFLWPHHYQCYKFFEQEIINLGEQDRILEIGSGHGLYLLKMVKYMSPFKCYDVVDISDTSINMTKQIVQCIHPEFLDQINLYHCDVNDHQPDELYDFISLSEVLEHVDCPLAMLKKVRRLLKTEGKLYISTCANCPTIDHAFHFTDVDHIRKTISNAGFSIVSDKVIPSENVSQEVLEKHKLDISYVTILSKTG